MSRLARKLLVVLAIGVGTWLLGSSVVLCCKAAENDRAHRDECKLADERYGLLRQDLSEVKADVKTLLGRAGSSKPLAGGR